MASGQSRANPEPIPSDPGSIPDLVFVGYGDPGPIPDLVFMGYGDHGPIPDVAFAEYGICGDPSDPRPIPDLVFVGYMAIPDRSRTWFLWGSRCFQWLPGAPCRGPRGSRGLPSLPGASRGEPPGTPGASWANPKRSQIDPRPGFYGVRRSMTNSLFFFCYFFGLGSFFFHAFALQAAWHNRTKG